MSKQKVMRVCDDCKQAKPKSSFMWASSTTCITCERAAIDKRYPRVRTTA